LDARDKGGEERPLLTVEEDVMKRMKGWAGYVTISKVYAASSLLRESLEYPKRPEVANHCRPSSSYSISRSFQHCCLNLDVDMSEAVVTDDRENWIIGGGLYANGIRFEAWGYRQSARIVE
jgi:hypothetical protein